MSIDTRTLIWLFPVAFMLHDFEEIILSEAWLQKNAGELKGILQNRLPAFLAKRMCAVLDKSAAEFALPISLIFGLTALSSFLAVEYGQYGFFLAASGLFFVHGFAHVAQAVAFRRYIPAVVTSVLVAIPYGLILYWRLITAGVIDIAGLLGYFLLGGALAAPFILTMHAIGEYLYKKMVAPLSISHPSSNQE